MRITVYIHGDGDPLVRVHALRPGEQFVYADLGDVSLHFPGTGEENLRAARDFAMAILGALVNHGGGLPDAPREPIEPALEEIPL